ncbi:MAG TPA: diol dehydratase small subunit [Dongiaceae bacterium]|nr:diol dehydratase small subunit [Dongiaceae bacterium]
MSKQPTDRPALTIADYPLAEKRPELVRTASGKELSAVSLEAVEAGQVTMADLRITATALQQQAAIARAANRATLAQNFQRAAELVDIPQDILLQVYELLRPGRAKDKSALLAAAEMLRHNYNAMLIADFVAEAAAVYERRGLFTRRF